MMRYRVWAVIGMILLTVALSSCTTTRVARSTVGTPVPTKTLRPTFTSTVGIPTLTPSPTAVPATATSEAPTATTEPPTPTASPTSEAAKLTVNSAANVRSGPGTNYAQTGQLQPGQSFVITGKNPAGDWWQFDYNGQAGWVLGQMVRASGGERVEVVANIPPPPTTAPRPTARPQPPQPKPQPTQPPAAAYQYAAVRAASFPNTNDYTTVRCRATDDLSKAWGPAGILLVTGPVSAPPQPFGTHLDMANTGMQSNMQYRYSQDCKVELRPFVAGTYTGILVDGSGKQISDPITFASTGDTREFVLIWKPR